MYHYLPPAQLPIPRLRRQDTECQAEGWTRAWRGMTFGHDFNQKLKGVKLPNNHQNLIFGNLFLGEGLSNPFGIYEYIPAYPHTHIIYLSLIHSPPWPVQKVRQQSGTGLALGWMGKNKWINMNIDRYIFIFIYLSLMKATPQLLTPIVAGRSNVARHSNYLKHTTFTAVIISSTKAWGILYKSLCLKRV